MRLMLTRQLAQMGDRELAAFADCYPAARDHAYCWPQIEAVTVAFGHYGDDAFDNVQNWLICQGRRVYTQVLANPDHIVDFLRPAGEEAFADAELFHVPVYEELSGRPGAAELREYHQSRTGPLGVRSDLGDAASVHARYPRCAAVREKYLNSQLPSISLPKTENVRSNPTRKLALGATWSPRRQ